MVRRSPFWSYLRDKRCLLCGDRLESSHASNIRKHFLRRHIAEYERIKEGEPTRAETSDSLRAAATWLPPTAAVASNAGVDSAATAAAAAVTHVNGARLINGRRRRRVSAAAAAGGDGDVSPLDYYTAAAWPLRISMTSSTIFPPPIAPLPPHADDERLNASASPASSPIAAAAVADPMADIAALLAAASGPSTTNASSPVWRAVASMSGAAKNRLRTPSGANFHSLLAGNRRCRAADRRSR